MSLVRRDGRDAERRAPVGVQAAHEPSRTSVVNQAGQHVKEAPDRVDGRTVRRPQRLRHAVERPEVQRGGIDEHQRRSHPSIMPCLPRR